MDWKRGLGLVAALALLAGGLLLLVYKPEGVTITWETATEVDTMGFNVFRAEGSAEAEFEQVNDELIPAKGDPLTGAAYEVRDDGATAGRLYFYQVEEVEWGGGAQPASGDCPGAGWRLPPVANCRGGGFDPVERCVALRSVSPRPERESGLG